MNRRAQHVDKVKEEYDALSAEESEEECEGPHPLLEKIEEVVAMEDEPNGRMWLLDSIEQLLCTKRFIFF